MVAPGSGSQVRLIPVLRTLVTMGNYLTLTHKAQIELIFSQMSLRIYVL